LGLNECNYADSRECIWYIILVSLLFIIAIVSLTFHASNLSSYAMPEAVCACVFHPLGFVSFGLFYSFRSVCCLLLVYFASLWAL
jgi:hypothetical protein